MAGSGIVMEASPGCTAPLRPAPVPMDVALEGLKSIAARMQPSDGMKRCERLGDLIDRGLDHVHQLGGPPVAHPHGARQGAMVEQARLYATEALPHFRGR